MKYLAAVLIFLVALAYAPVSIVNEGGPDFEAMVDANVSINGNCSGTHIGDGLILTAAHCVRHVGVDGEVRVIQQRDGAHWIQRLIQQGTVEWMDMDVDLAVVYLKDGSPYGTANLCRREPVLGEKVYHMGNPAGQNDTLLDGLVSKVIKKIMIEGIERLYFQVNAGLVGGSSGGALYDEGGCLIGVNAAGIGGTLIGAAVPVTLLPEEY